jgi:hypothetical protein
MSWPIDHQGAARAKKRDMATLPLLELPLLAPSQPVDTSRAAAVSVSAYLAKSLRVRVYALVKDGGATADECARSLGADSHSIAPRLWELERLGLVYKSEDRRPTRGGRLARVYRVREGDR